MLPLIQNFETYYRFIEAYIHTVCNGTLLGLGNTAKRKSGMCVSSDVLQQTCKPHSYASSKLQLSHQLTGWVLKLQALQKLVKYDHQMKPMILIEFVGLFVVFLLKEHCSIHTLSNGTAAFIYISKGQCCLYLYLYIYVCFLLGTSFVLFFSLMRECHALPEFL